MSNTQNTPQDRYYVRAIGECSANWACTRSLTNPDDARAQFALINNVPLSSVYCSENAR